MEKEEILRKIADMEYQLFSRINATNPDCKREGTFKFMRIARFYPLSEDTLLSYLRDLEEASRRGKNPLWEKYACMEGRISVGDEEKRGIINKIVEIEKGWVEELHRKYPHVVELKEDFSKYLGCELATFSISTLKKYLNDLYLALKQRRNLAYESYQYTFSHLGYHSLEEVENKMKDDSQQRSILT